MKNLLSISFIIVTLMFIFQISFCDTESAKLYNTANEHYTRKEYQKALDIYLELLERGVQNPLLFYNLANTYYKTGSLGYAVLYYEKALLLKPFDRDIRANLTFVERNLTDRIRPLHDEGVLRIFKNLSSYLKPKVTVIIESLFFTIFIIFMQIFIFFPLLREKMKKPLITTAVLFVIALMGVLGQWSSIKNHPRGVIIAETVEVKSSPITESETLFSLHSGTRFRLTEKRDEWIRFSIADGRQGWIKLNTTALIEIEYHRVKDAGPAKII
jgi:tetratricopeptide (TPR) repeat protein